MKDIIRKEALKAIQNKLEDIIRIETYPSTVYEKYNLLSLFCCTVKAKVKSEKRVFRIIILVHRNLDTITLNIDLSTYPLRHEPKEKNVNNHHRIFLPPTIEATLVFQT